MEKNNLLVFFSEEEIKKAGKFLLGFGITFLVTSGALLLIPLEWIEYFFAAVTLFFLNLFGFSGKIFFGEPVLIQLESIANPIAISYLCTGLLEAVIVFSAVISSFGIKIKKRIVGIIAAIFTIVAFNVFRIVSSILIIIYFGMDTAVFSHDILFKIFLFATVAGFYFYWFKWATKEKH